MDGIELGCSDPFLDDGSSGIYLLGGTTDCAETTAQLAALATQFCATEGATAEGEGEEGDDDAGEGAEGDADAGEGTTTTSPCTKLEREKGTQLALQRVISAPIPPLSKNPPLALAL